MYGTQKDFAGSASSYFEWKRTGTRIAATGAVSLMLLLSAGCQRILNGPQKEDLDQVRPDQIRNFDTLYANNCAGCHGADGKNGPAIPMNNPEYMALASDEQIKNVTANGQTGTLMPAFSQSAGGLLTDEQINVIVSGMRQRWGKPMAGINPPPYATHLTANAAHGQQVYTAACASCHGAATDSATAPTDQEARSNMAGHTSTSGSGNGVAGGKVGSAGSVTDPTFLALLSDQSLRTIIIAGRPDLGQPDWRGNVPGHPLSDQEITDVVAWLASHRQPLPGQPHPDPGGSELQRRVQ
jgi:cytochrome c oxidase cbb3-type subunit 3/ubiquinol-cytochrome c reductase cytochrome c subunit